MQPPARPRADKDADESDGRFGVAWLLIDMALITAMTVIVKLQGTSYPAIQLVFIRSLIGLAVVLPLAWRHRARLVGVTAWGRHGARVACNAAALTCNFAALTLLPLALVNAIGYLRPLMVMVLAVALLGERVGGRGWLGAGIGFAGVLVMVAPGSVALPVGVLAALGAVLFGSLATVQTRALRAEGTTVLMVFYTVGLSLFTMLPAWWVWQPVARADLVPLLAIGLLAQAGQYCYLRAYQSTRASRLSPYGYLSIVFASLAGFAVFAEVPAWTTLAGVTIVLAGLMLTRRAG